MAEICPICGLPIDICACEEISKEQQKIRVRLETRRFRKKVTVIDGFDKKDVDVGRLSKKLKSYCACGGTSKNGRIMLQGDQRERTHDYLIKEGFPKENVDVT
jgi:translation initiation factor 1